MYLIVVGAGKIGSNFIELATQDGNDIVVIEEDERVANEIADEYDCLVINADAAQDDVLVDAGIEKADAVVSTTNLDAVNIMVMLLAQEHDVPSLVSVVRDPKHDDIFEKIGVNIIENPQRLIADYLYHSVRYPAVKDFMDIGKQTELVQITVDENAPITGVDLTTARREGLISEDTVVVAVKRGDEILTPKGNTEIRAGDLVTVFVNESKMDDAVDCFSTNGNGD
jgi:trk system potassium uptake protein TrkA